MRKKEDPFQYQSLGASQKFTHSLLNVQIRTLNPLDKFLHMIEPNFICFGIYKKVYNISWTLTRLHQRVTKYKYPEIMAHVTLTDLSH